MLKSLLAIVCLLCSIGVCAYDFEVDGIYYNITDRIYKTVEVTDNYDNEYTGSIVIPENVTYNNTTYNVTSIGNYAFRDCNALTEVTIGNSVTIM